jgi:hypothetical protein
MRMLRGYAGSDSRTVTKDSIRRAARTLAGATALCLCAHAHAGVYVEASRADLQSPLQAPQTQKMWFDDGKFRLENERGDAVQIYEDGMLYLVEPHLGHAGALESAGRVMRSESLTEATVTAAADRRVSETARQETVGDLRCRIWEVSAGGMKVGELCIAAPGSLPGGEQLLPTMRQLSEFADRCAQSTERAARESVIALWTSLGATNGIPLLARSFLDGQPLVEVRLTAVRADSVPVTAFELPAGGRHRPAASRTASSASPGAS